MTKRIMLLTTLLVMGITAVLAQGRSVTGVVLYASDNEPVMGAYVELVGDKSVAQTDIDGKFTFPDVPRSVKMLRVSYIGMKPVEANIREKMTILMEEESKQIDEVMVVAFGKAKKESFTGSAAVLGSEKIAQVSTSNVTDALAGQVAGVQTFKTSGRPGGGSSVLIRGFGSFSASNTPLYIVDGAPYEGDIAAINPSDIASLTVMKDAAANALYGARGANGVIIITTKQGQRGTAKVVLDAKWGTNSRAVKNYDVMRNPNTYMETLYKAMYNNRYDQLIASNTPEQAAVMANQYANKYIFTTQNMGVGYQMYTVPEGQNFIGLNGRINPNAVLGNVIGDYYYTADNWEKQLLDSNNLRQEYNASVSGGSEKNDFLVSFGYTSDTGMIPKSGFDRFTGRVKNEYRIKDWLRVGENVSYTHYKYADPEGQSGTASGGNVFTTANNIAPIYSLFVRDKNGCPYYDKNGYLVYEFGDGTSSDIRRSFFSGSNPAADLMLNQCHYLSNIFNGNIYAEADIWKGLRARVSYNYFTDDTRGNTLVNKYYGQYSEMFEAAGIVSVEHQRQTNTNLQALLTYRNTFRDKHTLDLMLGHELYTSSFSTLYGSKNKLFSNNVAELGNAINNPATSSATDHYTTEGFIFRGQYDFMEKYFASVSFRRDGSSRFSKSHRWGNFWSLGGAWLINRENWFKAKWVDLLKLKASYGEQGNDKIGGYYPWTNQYGIQNVNGNISISQVYQGNKDLTWETSRNVNVGIDFELFRRRLNGTIEWFNRQTDDMLYNSPTAISNGISSYPTNIGSVRNRGVEVDLNGVLYEHKDLYIGMNVNATHIKNTIIRLDPEQKGSYISGTYMRREGGSMYNFYMPRWAGVDVQTGRATWWKDVKDAAGNVTGHEKTFTYDEATRYEIGDILPKLNGGFGLNARYKGFDFAINFSYQMGGKMYDSGYASLMHNGEDTGDAGRNWHRDMLNAWTPENPYSDIPRLTTAASARYDSYTSTRFLISSNYLSLNNINFGYSIPKSLLSKVRVERLRIYLAAENVALWSKRHGMDPRMNVASSTNSEYSILRTLSCGLNVEF